MGNGICLFSLLTKSVWNCNTLLSCLAYYGNGNSTSILQPEMDRNKLEIIINWKLFDYIDHSTKELK